MQPKQIGKAALIALAALAGLGIFWGVVLPLFWPFLAGLAVAALAQKPAGALCARGKLSHPAAARGCAAGFYVLAGAGCFFLGRVLCGELAELLKRLPALAARMEPVLQQMKARLFAAADKFPDGIGQGLRAGLESFFAGGAGLGSRLYEKVFVFASTFFKKLPAMFLGLVTAVLSGLMLAGQWQALRRVYAAHVPPRWKRRLSVFACQTAQTLRAWLGAQCKLMGVTFLILTAGFFLLRIDYALLLAVLITVLDALPVFGTGTVLIPWSMVRFLEGNARCGVGLLLLYAASALTRQALEPRLLGGQIGLPPVVTLAALYVGWRVMGVAGMIALPMLAVLCVRLCKAIPPRKPGREA